MRPAHRWQRKAQRAACSAPAKPVGFGQPPVSLFERLGLIDPDWMATALSLTDFLLVTGGVSRKSRAAEEARREQILCAEDDHGLPFS